MCLSSPLFSNLFPQKRRPSDLLAEFLCGTFGVFLLPRRLTGALFCNFGPTRHIGGRNVPVQELLKSWFKISFLLWSFPGSATEASAASPVAGPGLTLVLRAGGNGKPQQKSAFHVLKSDVAAVYFLSNGRAAKFRADQMTSALPFEDAAAAAESAAVKSFNHQLFWLKFWSVSIQRTDGVPQNPARRPSFGGKTKPGTLRDAVLAGSFQQKRRSTRGGELWKVGAGRVSTFRDGGSAHITHRWISSLDSIDRPHEKDLCRPPRGWKPTLLVPPHPHPARLHTYFRSEKDAGWYTWELLISGRVFVVSCLRIQTNKGQWSHTSRLTTPAFLAPAHPPVCSSRRTSRTHTHTHLFCFSILVSDCLSHWPLEPLRFTKHLQTAPL